MKSIYSMLLMLSVMFALAGCGGGVGGSASSTGTEDTGILIRAVSVESAGSDEEGSPDVDANIHMCDSDPEPGLAAVPVTLNIDATKIASDSPFNPFPATVERCTITYRKANEDPNSPIIEQWTQYPNCVLEDGTNTCAIRLIDIERKVRWWSDVTSGKFTPSEYPTHYVAVYRCRYTGQFGREGFFETEFDFWLADFDLC